MSHIARLGAASGHLDTLVAPGRTHPRVIRGRLLRRTRSTADVPIVRAFVTRTEIVAPAGSLRPRNSDRAQARLPRLSFV